MLAVPHVDFTHKLIAAAIERTHHSVRYVSDYIRIPYPAGDVPSARTKISGSVAPSGLTYRKKFTKVWLRALTCIHTNDSTVSTPSIDHRRVPNLMVFSSRNGTVLSATRRSEDFSLGDLVVWDLGGGIMHIGIVVDRKGSGGSYMLVHNIGRGPQMEDVLFDWKIIGHYRYYGPRL